MMRHMAYTWVAVVLLAANSLAFRSTAVAAAVPPAAHYDLGKASEVVYHVVHPFHHVRATSHDLSGHLSLVDGHLVTPVVLTLPLITFDSGNASRDSNAALALDIAKFSHATLAVAQITESTRVRDKADLRITATATGKLTLHGINKTVTLPLQAVVSPTTLTVDAAFSVWLSDYQIPRPSLLFRPVDDEVKIEVHAVAPATTRAIN